MGTVDLSKVVKVEEYREILRGDQTDFDQMLIDAQSELDYYDWCLEIFQSYVGIFFAGVVGVFLFKIRPSSPDVDEWVWVILGDLPSTYITTEDSPNPACALDSYIGAMQRWVEAAESGQPVDDLVPVNVPANKENAAALKTRLRMLDERVLSEYEEDLKA